MIISLFTSCILCVVTEKGSVHDFKIFKDSALLIHPDLMILADLGYLGLNKLHVNSWIPHKNSKKKKLNKEQKKDNKALASLRITIENVNRKCKIFRVVKETYRGKHKNYSKVWNVVAGLVNLRYAA